MATITASLERSLQNCSLNQTTRSRRANTAGSGGLGRSDSPEIIDHHQNQHQHRSRRINNESTHCSNASSSDENSTFVELNSHVSLPYHWEQCLDLKTGELYYINWSNGMKAKEDPRTTATGYNGDYYSEEEEDEDEDGEEESNCYDSESSSTESSPCSSNRKESFRAIKKQQLPHQQQQQQQLSQDSVLVVAGCKSCFMYYMVPKHVEDCPKCSGQLLHFAANNNTNNNDSSP